MKRLLLLLALCLCIGSVSAFTATFQNAGDYPEYITCYGGSSCYWTGYSTGGNGYARNTGSDTFLINSAATPTTYWAATIWMTYQPGYGYNYIKLFDSAHGTLYTCILTITSTGWYRVEMRMIEGQAHIYINGKDIGYSTLLSSNPQYIGVAGHTYPFGDASYNVDDWVYGDTENKYIFGMPQSGFVLIKDSIGSTNSGLYYPNETTIVSNYNMTSTWGKGIDNTSVTVGLYNIEIQNSPVCTYTTTTGTMSGSIAWPLGACLFDNASSHYGYYYTSVYGSGVLSNLIVYKGKGAAVTFDKNFYSTGEPAAMVWTIDSFPYWDTVNYDYELRVVDVYGTEKYSQTITSQAGSGSYTWTDNDNSGVYYAEVHAISKGSGNNILMAYDYTTLSGTFGISGYVNEDETALPISGALVNFTQGSTSVNTVSASDGSYNATGFTTGTLLWYNASATGYQPFNYSFTPGYAHTISINITLPKSTHSGTGIFAGGVARDSTYGRPIPNVLVAIENTTSGQYYSATTNNAGWYNKSGLIYLNTYDIWGYKIGYSNSTVYKKQMTGLL